MLETLEAIGIALLRKAIFLGMLWGFFRLTDIYYCKAFDTDVLFKESPNAVAVFYAGLFIAAALA